MKFYDVLGVPKAATTDQIKKAYRKLAMEHHPDRNPGNKQAEEKFKEITEAYAILSDEGKRAQYDQTGDTPFQAQGFREDMFRDVDYSSIFEEMGFGAGNDFSSFFGNTRSKNGRRQNGRRPGTGGFGARMDYSQFDIEHPLEISFFDAYNGSEKQINLKLSNGEQVNVRVKIPVGVEENTKLRVKGCGARRPDGLKGDLYLQIKNLTHPSFERKGLDVESTQMVPLSLLILGGSAEVQTPQGIRSVKIKENLGIGKKLRLKELGFSKENTKGDFYVTLQPKIPEKDEMSPEAISLFQNLRDLGF